MARRRTVPRPDRALNRPTNQRQLRRPAGVETEFIKLFDYTIAPCKACLGCVKTNRYVIKDDAIELAEKVKAADALVVGAFTPYSSLDSRTKAFLERLYPLRHRCGFLAKKPAAAVVTTAVPRGVEGLPPGADMGVNAIQFFAMEEGIEFVGSVVIDGNVSCVKCGIGDEVLEIRWPRFFDPGKPLWARRRSLGCCLPGSTEWPADAGHSSLYSLRTRESPLSAVLLTRK